MVRLSGITVRGAAALIAFATMTACRSNDLGGGGGGSGGAGRGGVGGVATGTGGVGGASGGHAGGGTGGQDAGGQDAATGCPPADGRGNVCRTTWDAVVANPSCFPLGQPFDQLVGTCGAYNVNKFVPVDQPGPTCYYDRSTGQLVAITIDCPRLPAGIPPCPDAPPLVDICLLDASVDGRPRDATASDAAPSDAAASR